jgi:hypothetical protein
MRRAGCFSPAALLLGAGRFLAALFVRRQGWGG